MLYLIENERANEILQNFADYKSQFLRNQEYGEVKLQVL